MRRKPPSAACVWLAILFALDAAGPTAADPVVPGEEHCVVNVRSDDVLYVRDGPSAGAAIAARKRHDACGILVHRRCRGNWCPVEDGHSLGWANRRYLATVSPALYCVSGVPRGDTLNLRAFPSPQSRVIGRLARTQCDIAFLPYRDGSWQKVRVRGRQGWVNQRYLSGE
ncbi:MAG: SH3 domain-containing protein [Pseudomonadota bacterium]|nr:SH3 domain-containing protein [Pseudomonadota bacterium]